MKDTRIAKVIVMLKEWKRMADKEFKRSEFTKDYWAGQLSIINSMLKILSIFK